MATWQHGQHGQGALLQRPRTLKSGAEGAPGRRRRVALFHALAASAGSRPSFWPTTPLLPIFSSSPSLIITTIFLEMHSPAPLAGHAHPQTRCPSRCPRAPQAAYKHPSFAADDRRGGHSHQKSARSSVQCHEIAQSPRCDRLPPQRIAESHSQPRGQPTNCSPTPASFFFLLVSSSHHPNNPTGRPQVEDSSNVTRRSHRHSYGTGLAAVLALPASGCHTEFVLEIEPPSTGHAPRKKNKKSASRDSPPLPSNHHLRPRNGLASAGDVASLQSTCQLTADHGGSRTPSCSAHALASAQQPSAGSSNATCSERPVSGITSQQPATVHCPPTGRLWLIASASPHRSSNNSPSLTETTASLAPRLHGNTVAPSSPRPSVVVAGRDTSRRPVNRR